MLVIPVQPVAAQTLNVTLANQATRVAIYRKTTGLYADVYVNDALIIGGIICQDRKKIVRDAYLGFVGDLAFFDLQGTEDPDYTELGSRFILGYLDA